MWILTRCVRDYHGFPHGKGESVEVIGQPMQRADFDPQHSIIKVKFPSNEHGGSVFAHELELQDDGR